MLDINNDVLAGFARPNRICSQPLFEGGVLNRRRVSTFVGYGFVCFYPRS